MGVIVTPEQVRDRFERNEFRSSLPRVASWRVAEYSGTAEYQPPEMAPMIAGYVERQAVWVVGENGSLTFVSSVARNAHRLNYPVRAIPKAKFSVDRLRSIFAQFSRAEGRFDDVFSVTDPKAVIGVGDRLSKAIPSGARRWLDSARPWVATEVLEQIGLQVLERERFAEKRRVAEQRDEPS